MFCSHCGGAQPEAAAFCSACGMGMAPSGPIPAAAPSANRLETPWYLRWIIIIPAFFVFPAGTFISLGLMRIRWKTVPGSRATMGWIMFLMGLVSAPLTYVLGSILVGWLWGDASGYFRVVYALAGLYFAMSLYGLIVALRARKVDRLVKAIDSKGLRTADDVAQELRRNDIDSVRKEIGRAIKRGWLNGYQIDAASGAISFSSQPASFFQVIRRSWSGAFLLLIGLALLPGTLMEYSDGGKSSSSILRSVGGGGGYRPTTPYSDPSREMRQHDTYRQQQNEHRVNKELGHPDWGHENAH